MSGSRGPSAGAANDAEKLEVFRRFWESGEALIGEAGARGWLHAAAPSALDPQARGTLPAPRPPPGCTQGRGPSSALWLPHSMVSAGAPLLHSIRENGAGFGGVCIPSLRCGLRLERASGTRSPRERQQRTQRD